MGRLTSIAYTNPSSSSPDSIVEAYSYTAPGQVSQKQVTIGRCVGVCTYASPLNLNYTYDSEGHRLTMNTPSRNFNYTYDQMERASGMTDAGTGTALVSGISYGPSNETLQISYGDLYAGTYHGVTETRTYNSLLQLTQLVSSGHLGASSVNVNLTYNYSATQNNGKISSTTNSVSGETAQYTYDSLNRLIQAQATSGSWGQGFVYDGFGNLYQKNVTAGSAPSMNFNVDATTNRLTNAGSPAFAYDNNGNTLSGPNMSGVAHYDFLNRVIEYANNPTNTVYAYDASNRRIYKAPVQANGAYGTESYYLYGIGGENLGTYTATYVVSPASFTLTLAQSRVYFFSKKLFMTEDNVGSGVSAGSYYPFGEDKGSSPPPNEQFKFATYWRDGESGLDYANNRYYTATLGRFLTTDPYSGSMDMTNPASFNRYAYVTGDPINNNDPLGLCWYQGLLTGPPSGCGVDWVAANTGGWSVNEGTEGGYADVDNTFNSYTAPPSSGLSNAGTVTQFDQGASDQGGYTSGYGAPSGGVGGLPEYGQSNPTFADIQTRNTMPQQDDGSYDPAGSLSGAFGGANSNDATEQWHTPPQTTYGSLTLPFAPNPYTTCPAGYHPDPSRGPGCFVIPAPTKPPRPVRGPHKPVQGSPEEGSPVARGPFDGGTLLVRGPVRGNGALLDK